MADTTDSGYQLYHPTMIQRVVQIRALQGQRVTLSEIKGRLESQVTRVCLSGAFKDLRTDSFANLCK
ncbi:MAG: DNA-binding transcriptional MerR regulator [Lentimonas sp.]